MAFSFELISYIIEYINKHCSRNQDRFEVLFRLDCWGVVVSAVVIRENERPVCKFFILEEPGLNPFGCWEVCPNWHPVGCSVTELFSATRGKREQT